MKQLIIEAFQVTHVQSGSSSAVHFISFHFISDSFSGGSPDWARGVAGIKFPFLIELRDMGEFGFLLPSEQIEPTALETWAGIKVCS